MMFINKNFLFFISIFLIVNIISIVINLIFIKKNIYKLKFINDYQIEFIINDYFKESPKNIGTIIFKNIDELRTDSMIKLLNDKNICLNSSNNDINRQLFNFLKLSLPFVEISIDHFGDSVDIDYIYNDPIDKIYRVTFTRNEYNFKIGLFSKDKYYNAKYLNDVSESIKKNILYSYQPKQIDINYNDYINRNYINLLINLENSIYVNIVSKYNFINPNHELSEKVNYSNYKKFINFNHQFYLILKNIYYYRNYSKEFFTKYDKYLNKCEKEILILLNNLNTFSFLNNIEYNNEVESDKFYNAINENKFEISNSSEIKIFTLPVIIKFLIFHLLITFLLLYLFRLIWN